MRLRGYSVMTNVLQDHTSNMELLCLVCPLFIQKIALVDVMPSLLPQALESLISWPLVNRNKVMDSKVHVPVQSCATLENETVKGLAQKVIMCTTLCMRPSHGYISF